MCIERMNVIGEVMSSDGDCIMYGTKNLHCEWNFKKRTFRLCDKESLNVEGNHMFKHDQCHWCVIGAMLGCDYLKRVSDCGFATLFNKVFPVLV